MWGVRAEADRWRRQAANDLAFARVALRERFYAQACLIAQQGAEKAVKAIAYGLGERTVVGHSLVTLILRYRDRAPKLKGLRELAGILDQCYVHVIRTVSPAESRSRRSGESQAAAAVDAADRFVQLAGERARSRE